MERPKLYMQKLLYYLSSNARMKKKRISRKLHKSPQLVSYAVEKLSSAGTIKAFETIVDPARFGLTNIRVFLVYTTFEKDKQRQILSYLDESEHVTYIEETSHGVDLIVEYTVPNLSYFNKLHTQFLEQFSQEVQVLEINPVIVRHVFPRKYLNRRSKEGTEIVLSGDREPTELQERERSVLRLLIQEPLITQTEIAKRTDLNVRTVAKLMHSLEQKRIIRGYGIRLNYESLDLSVCNVLISFQNPAPETTDRLVQFCSLVPEIVSVSKLIGRHNILIRIESLKGYKQILQQLRKEFMFYQYRVYDSSTILKQSYVPLTEI